MSLFSDSISFIVDSSQRLNFSTTTSSSFQIQLNIPKGREFDRVCVVNAIIPKSYWLVNAPYNTLILSENGTNTIVTVPEGNYNAISWCTLFANLLTSASTENWTYSIAFPNPATQNYNGLFVYSCTGGTGTQPQLIFPSTPTTSLLYEQCGFTVGSTNTFVGGLLTSANVIKFQVEDIIYVHSNMAYSSTQSATSDVLLPIFASSSPNFTNIIVNNYGTIEASSKILLSSDQNLFSYTITDEHQNPINLRGLDYSMEIVVYKKESINQLIAQDMIRNKDNGLILAHILQQLQMMNQILQQNLLLTQLLGRQLTEQPQQEQEVVPNEVPQIAPN